MKPKGMWTRLHPGQTSFGYGMGIVRITKDTTENERTTTMTKKQRRLHKLGNAVRRIAGGENTQPDRSKGAQEHLAKRKAALKAGDL